MQLIGMLDSPYVRRVAVTLLEAGVAFEHRPISLFRRIDAFSRISPLLKAPTLVAEDGTALVDSGVILEYLASRFPAVAGLRPATRLAFQLTGVGLTVCEKAVQLHYERALRTLAERSESWTARIVGQLAAGLRALDSALPAAGWIDERGVGVADITAACALGFLRGALSDAFDPTVHPNLAAFADRAEQRPAFRAAPPIDGAAAPVAARLEVG